jgi:hypothetical protein
MGDSRDDDVTALPERQNLTDAFTLNRFVANGENVVDPPLGLHAPPA